MHKEKKKKRNLCESTVNILKKFHNQLAPLSEEEEGKWQIIATAAKLVQADIKNKPDQDFYPPKEKVTLEKAIVFFLALLMHF